MDRSKKSSIIEDVNNRCSSASVVVVARYAGLSVKDTTSLRIKARASGVGVKVVKASLVRLALKDTIFESAGQFFGGGPAMLLSSQNPVAAPKVCAEYAKSNDNFVVLGGCVVGSGVLNADGIGELASLPDLDGLRSQLVGLINQPMAMLARIINAPGEALSRVIQAHLDKNQ